MFVPKSNEVEIYILEYFCVQNKLTKTGRTAICSQDSVSERKINNIKHNFRNMHINFGNLV